MVTYTYQARDANGQAVDGQIEAADESAASMALGNRDLTVVSLQASVGHKVSKKKAAGRIKIQDLVAFTRQLATMMDAGLPLVQALTSLEEQATSKPFKAVLKQVTEQVEQGQAFSEALAQHPLVFNEIYVNLVQAGEAGGLLAEILERLATEQESSARLKRKVKSAMTYPTIVTCIAFSISLFLILKIVPMFADIFKDLGGKLPMPTQVLLKISATLQHYFLYVAALVAAVGYALNRFKKTRYGTQKWDQLKLRLPVAGPLTKKVVLTRFARTFSSLTHSGVPILQTLKIAGCSAGNTVLEFAAAGMIESIEKGDSLSVAMAQYHIFPPMMVRMVSAGEQTGRVDTMLEKMAEFYNEEVETTLAGLTALIEPLLIVFIGVVVGSIVICMFLPIFGMSDQIK